MGSNNLLPIQTTSFSKEKIYKMLFSHLAETIFGLIRMVTGNSGDIEGQDHIKANGDSWTVENERHGKTEEELVDEIGNLQNLIEHLKEIFIGEKSELCAKINSLENTIEKDDVLREEACKTKQDLEKLKEEIGQLNFEKQVLLDEQKLTNDKHEEDMKKLEMEFNNESERVKQLNIQNKMIMAENQWLKTSLKQSHDEYSKDMEKIMKDLEEEKMKHTWKLW